MNGGGYETPSKAEIWSRFKTEGFFDVPSLKTKDYAAKNARIAALEAKLHNYQHQMGLLLLERETWTPQVDELKDALAESEMQASIQETELRTQLDDAQQMIEKLSAKEEERKSCQVISVPLVVAEPGADMSSGCMVSAAAGVSSKGLPEQQDGTSEQHDLQEDFTFWRGNSVQAVSNEDASGDVKALLDQIEKMKEELTRSAMENIRLLDQIRSLQEFHEGGEREKKALELELAAAARENELLRLENDNFRSEVEALRSNFSCSLERSLSMGRKVEELQELVEKLKVEGLSSTKLRQTEAVVAGVLRREQAAEEPKKPLTAHIEEPNRLTKKKKVKKKKEKPYVKWTDEETNALKKGVAEHGEGKWQEPTGVEKIMEIDEHIGCAMSGLTADARTLVEHGRVKTQNLRFSYNKSMSVESTTRALCDLPLCFGEGDEESMSRPFGVSLLIAGHDKTRPCLYHTDLSGTFWQCNAKAIGSGSEEPFNKNMTLEEAETLALSTLKQVMEEKVAPLIDRFEHMHQHTIDTVLLAECYCDLKTLSFHFVMLPVVDTLHDATLPPMEKL